MTNAQLANAAGEATDVIGDLAARLETERQWLQSVLREIAERAGVAPIPTLDEERE